MALCAQCSKPFEVNKRGRPRRFCTQCRPPWEAKDYGERACVVCGQRYKPTQRQQVICRREPCIAAARLQRARTPKPFDPEYGRRQRERMTPEQRERYRAMRRNRKHRRRARLGAREGAADPLLEQVAERDEWVCHLCRNTLGPVTRENWSLEHVVPLAAGGAHSPENVALAHHRCNTLKGLKNVVEITFA